eukprot:52077_1
MSVLEVLLTFLTVTFEYQCVAQSTWTGILRQKDITATDGLFNPIIRDRRSSMFGLENPTNPTANTFSIIGALQNQKSLFQQTSNEYLFKLVYHNLNDETTYNLVWSQKSWVTESDIIDFKKYTSSTYTFPNEKIKRFKGLGYSGGAAAFLDGNGDLSQWWNAVGSIKRFQDGMPGFNGDVAKSVHLCVCSANSDCQPDANCSWNVTSATISAAKPANVVYEGPAHYDYFESIFDQDIIELTVTISDQTVMKTNIVQEFFDVSKLDELKCGTRLNGETTATNPVNYYRFQITDDMLMYKSLLNIQTCCEFEGATLSAEKMTWWYSTGVYVLNGENECRDICSTQQYRKHCDTESLDTILYILKIKKGYVNLVETADDIDPKRCSNRDKSRIDLFGYVADEYIIGIGGYRNDIGRYFIQWECAKYSFPAKETELNPLAEEAYNVGNIACDATIHDTMLDETSNILHEIAYYKLDTTQNIWLPMTIKVCMDHDVAAVYVIKNRQGSQYEIVDSLAWYSWWNVNNHKWETNDASTHKVILDSSALSNEYWWCESHTIGIISIDNSYSNDEYNLVIQWTNRKPNQLQYRLRYTNLNRNEQDPPEYIIKTNCAPAPTLPPTQIPTQNPSTNPSKQPTIRPTSNPSHAPTIEPTYNPTLNPTIGPTFNPTANPSPAPTEEYSYPMHKVEYQSHLTDTKELLMYPTINCGDILVNQINTQEKLVSFYAFSVTNNLYPPSYITTCPPFDFDEDVNTNNMSVYDSVIYIIDDNSDQKMVLPRSEDAGCNRYSADIEISSLKKGDYFVAVQGYDNTIGNFSISMICTDPPPKIPRELVMAIVFGTCGVLLMLLFIYYIYEWMWYCKYKKICFYSGKYSLLVSDHDNDKIEQKNNLCRCCTVKFEENENTSIDQYELKIQPRRIDGDQSLKEQIQGNVKDAVQLTLAHALQCCEDQEGLDIYQVLAIRFYDEESRKNRATKPFHKIGINLQLVAVSPFFNTVVVAIVVGMSQIIGTSVVIYKLLNSFWMSWDEMDDTICVMDAWRWNMVYSLKILSFLLSLVITFYVSIIMNSLQHSGMYEITDRLTAKDMQRIDCVLLWVLQIGQWINYYVCLLAVIGSYFIIWDSNKGEELDDGSIDYSHAGLEMVLNVIALFFLLELDNLMITAQDYNDCKEHLERIMKCYYPDSAINSQYDNNDHEEMFTCNCCCYNNNIDMDENKLDVSDYSNWTDEDCVNWITSINPNFKIYEANLKTIFSDDELHEDPGIYLCNALKSDIVEWMIPTNKNNFHQEIKIKNELYQQIRITFKNNRSICGKYLIPCNHIIVNIFSVSVKCCCYGFGFIA